MIAGRFALALVAGAIPALAGACIPPAPTARLRYESDAQYQARSASRVQAIADEDRRSFQVALRERSASSFIGLVERRDAIRIEGGLPGFRILVRPVHALAGPLPATAISLSDRVLTSCGVAGGGTATGASPGDYVIVFRDMKFGGAPDREDYGIRAEEARDPLLLEAMQAFAATVSRAP